MLLSNFPINPSAVSDHAAAADFSGCRSKISGFLCRGQRREYCFGLYQAHHFPITHRVWAQAPLSPPYFSF